MIRKRTMGAVACGLLAMSGGLVVWAQEKKQEKKESQEQERKVTEAEVPPAALAGLKKVAGGAAFTEFSEEIEHGHTFYEGSWKGPEGNVDALVTPTGDLVELEEVVPAEKVPAGARAEAEKKAGKDAKMTWEKKTYIMYEVHFKKDGKGHEILYAPDGRSHDEEGESEDEDEEKD